jgi:hypothetical protein
MNEKLKWIESLHVSFLDNQSRYFMKADLQINIMRFQLYDDDSDGGSIGVIKEGDNFNRKARDLLSDEIPPNVRAVAQPRHDSRPIETTNDEKSCTSVKRWNSDLDSVTELVEEVELDFDDEFTIDGDTSTPIPTNTKVNREEGTNKTGRVPRGQKKKIDSLGPSQKLVDCLFSCAPWALTIRFW